MSYFRLGEVLIKEGLITENQLQAAVEEQKNRGDGARLGEVLISMGVITQESIVLALGSQLGIPYYTSENAAMLVPQREQNLEQYIPPDFCKNNLVLPLSLNMNVLTCAVADPLDLILIDNLKRLSGHEISLVVTTKSALETAIAKFFDDTKSSPVPSSKISLLDKAVEQSYDGEIESDLFVDSSSSAGSSTELSLDSLIEKAGEAPVIKLVDLIIRQAIDEKASDVHIEPFDNKIILRYRIDGSLVNIPPPAPHLHLAIVSRIKILARMNIAEKRLPQDGAITAKLEDRNVDLRVSTIPTVWGEKVVMRILDKSATPMELAKLGFDPKQIDSLKNALKSPHGLFFVRGPTGSGKSTTLYSALSETLDPKKNIITVEDPVEYKIEQINQVAVRSDIGLTFSSALRSFLRQDPDVILVGEVRDLETASICVRAALTGHFVLSTLHTNDAASAVTRLVDLGVPNYLLTPSLVMVVAQRLAKKLCPECKEPYEPDPAQHGGIEFKSDLIYRAKGCSDCNNLGYKGRAVVAEVLPVDEDIRKLLGDGADASQIKKLAVEKGMATIFDSGIKMVEKGLTSYDEICRVSVE